MISSLNCHPGQESALGGAPRTGIQEHGLGVEKEKDYKIINCNDAKNFQTIC